ncbi:MAG: acetylxylan esterase [Bryobacterales bacterium]|nr:acetylxylan esterase [Bryobacterales bacterium]
MRRQLLTAAAATATAAAAAKPRRKRTAAAPGNSRRAELYSLLGDLPARHRPVAAVSKGVEDRGAYTIEKLILDLNGIEDAPAYFVKPRGGTGRFPVVLYNHYHGGKYKLGKDELLTPKREAGLASYAEDLAAAGYASLCFDTWAFGERARRPELDIFKDMLWQGQVMWGMMVYDSLQAMDYLVSRPDVDAARIATLGMSMGSTMAWWTAALDERIKVTVDICCLTDYQALLAANNLKGHGVYYYVPGLLKHFTVSQINELIVPRPHLGLAGNRDTLTPPAGLDRIDANLKRAYAAAGQPGHWKLVREDVAHEETASMRAEVMAFLARHL